MEGYEKTQVDAYVERLSAGTRSPYSLPTPDFTVVLRGYDVGEVDRYVRRAQDRIAQLEMTIERLQGAE